MNQKEVDDILSKLLRAMPNGDQKVKTAYGDLIRIYNAWNADKTADNWRDVEYQPQGAMMWVPGENPKQ